MKPETTAVARHEFTLISAYSYKDECAQMGNATPKKKPAFFDKVVELLSDKPYSKPKVIIKFATSATIPLVVRCERDHQLTMYN